MEMLNVKVGVMPGKLEEVVVESGAKVKEIFALANIDIAGYETRLDGVVVDADKPVFNGALLVAMKKIKGNADVIKVGVMPGKLTEIAINEDTDVSRGSLLVAMKKIKGNTWENTEPFTYSDLPLVVKETKELGDMVVLDGRYVMNKEEFKKVYFEKEEHTCSCDVCTCEETDEYDVALVKSVLEDIELVIDKLSMSVLKLKIALENK